jgi:hypothetical protein
MQSRNSSKGTSSTGVSLLKDGRRRLDLVELRLGVDGPTDVLHGTLREALRVLRSAMNWLEDTPRFEVAHDLLDRGGRLARQHFSSDCHLSYVDGNYEQRCPVALAHNRVGLSTGMIIGKSSCSVCGRDPEECDHIGGRIYDGKTCHRIVEEIAELREIAFVARPRQPDCRILSATVDLGQLKKKLGKGFSVGVPVSCDRCLSPCSGVSRPME